MGYTGRRVKLIPCRDARGQVPVPHLDWWTYAEDCQAAEPLPGYRFSITPDPQLEGGWVAHIPGHPPTPVTRLGIAKATCEHAWFNAMRAFLEPHNVDND